MANTLRELALNVIWTYDIRLRDEVAMLAHGQAIEKLRVGLGTPESAMPVHASEPEALPFELQAMTHISRVLGALPSASRHRTLMVIALALAPDVFSDRQYGELLKRAKG